MFEFCCDFYGIFSLVASLILRFGPHIKLLMHLCDEPVVSWRLGFLVTCNDCTVIRMCFCLAVVDATIDC
jgi:hypothetical protein